MSDADATAELSPAITTHPERRTILRHTSEALEKLPSNMSKLVVAALVVGGAAAGGGSTNEHQVGQESKGHEGQIKFRDGWHAKGWAPQGGWWQPPVSKSSNVPIAILMVLDVRSGWS